LKLPPVTALMVTAYVAPGRSQPMTSVKSSCGLVLVGDDVLSMSLIRKSVIGSTSDVYVFTQYGGIAASSSWICPAGDDTSLAVTAARLASSAKADAANSVAPAAARAKDVLNKHFIRWTPSDQINDTPVSRMRGNARTGRRHTLARKLLIRIAGEDAGFPIGLSMQPPPDAKRNDLAESVPARGLAHNAGRCARI